MAKDGHGRVALATGCSTGIGRASARRLHDAGFDVYATARNVDSMAELAERGITTMALDVTDETSMTRAVAAVEDESGPVDVLLNNAGYGLYGTVEQLPMDEIRRQFDTNFFGLVRLIQLTLPGMRSAGRGRILNVSSMGGRITLPGGAFYHATKHAVEAMSDALRVEVRPFGIHVVLIEPGPVKTPWNDTAAMSIAAADQDDGSPDPYAAFKSAVASSFGSVTQGPLAKMVSTPDDIAKVITKAALAGTPRTRYLISAVARGFVTLDQVLPDRVFDAAIRRQYGLP